MFQLDRRAGRLDGRWLPAGAAQLLWDRIVREDPDLSPLLSPAGVARAAVQSWRRVHDHRIEVEALDAADTPETAAFVRWCREYRRHLGQHGWVDAATAQERVHACSAAPGIELAGFDRLTPLQQALVARWATDGIEVRHAARPQAPGTVRVLRCLDAAAELDAAARWAGALLDGRQHRRVAIVVPDLARRRDEVRRRLERVLAPVTGLAGGPEPETLALDIASARPLARQPVVAAALDLLSAHVGSPDLPTLSRLLRSPFIAGAAVEAQARARLDARLRRDARPGVRLRELSRLAEERDCPLLAGALAGAETVLSEWIEKSYPSECSSTMFDLLDAVGWPGASPGSPEHQAAQRWRDLVSEFGACDEFAGRVSRGEAVGQLREMAGRVLFEPQELHSPLRVIDADTSAGMQFDALWVCGLDAGRWPPPATPDPFLPREVQLRHGVPRASTGLATEEARRVLDRLLCSAAQVVLSVPEMEDDAPLVPSPMLAGIEPVADLARWPGERLAASVFRQRPRLETVADHALPGLGGGESPRGGARLLELQSACPFRAQAELRLGARALEEPAVGVDASERGTLVHRALAILWSGLGGHAALVALGPDETRSVVGRAVAAALAEARRSAGELMSRLLDLEAEWLESRVRDMVEADRVRPPFQVEALERPFPARIGPLVLELRPDRVDRLADGSLAVIDYKTGSRADVKAWLGERPRLPQLPAYVQALGSARVGAVAFARLRSGDTGYVGLARDGEHFPGLVAPGSRGWPKAYQRWETLLADWQLRLERLAGEFASGSARLAPDPREACKHCQLGALCRIASTDADLDGEEAADE